jgi:leucyl-tRNA synthetase
LAHQATKVQRLNTARTYDGVLTGALAVNPVNGRRVPILVADYVLPCHGTWAIMAVPAHDQRDLNFARRYGLPVIQVIRPAREDWPIDEAYEGEGVVVNSGSSDGQPSTKACHGIADMMVKKGYGRRSVQYRMRDWLISRQRYWGAPIPIIHCDRCGAAPVPKEDLPVRLPHMPDYQPRGDGRSSLANRPDFVNAACPSCGGPGQRETDTMGGFACSSWYFLRFADPGYDAGPCNP